MRETLVGTAGAAPASEQEILRQGSPSGFAIISSAILFVYIFRQTRDVVLKRKSC